eukprot:CAMPEP_0168444182 /NCGR_PEP_ID=MMETSP0228-20121227/44915_1 /TAXON_ID=133427 /ORGANISM="Protoceratium reticulatum, Strain CCCM 535 (=CCMP 1889)" /LENGTH=591 /DNA_ID=CAMNT_0008458613 /DNA_START=222 /DNA_END=1993 /DNA_ORIENTATION=+
MMVNGGLHDEHTQAQTSVILSKPLCADPTRYDYWWDQQGVSRASNISCMPMCTQGVTGRCLSAGDLSHSNFAGDHFFGTHLKETIDRGPRGMEQRDYMLPTAEIMGTARVIFDHFGPRPTFPILIEVQNPRLRILHCVASTGMVVLSVLLLIQPSSFSIATELGGGITASMMVHGAVHNEHTQAQTSALSLKPFCADPRRYDYWWDPQGVQTISNISCMPLCTHLVTGRCLSSGDLYHSNFAGDRFLGTHLQETIDRGPRGIEQRDYMLPTAEALNISVLFSYKMEVLAPWPIPARVVSGSVGESILTVVLDAQDRPWRIHRPNQKTVDFTLPELLELSGDRHLLDRLNVGAGENYLPGSEERAGPLTRLSGLAYDLHDEVTEQGEPARRSRTYHGISIRFRKFGHITAFQLSTLISSITSVFVLMGLPKKLVLAFMISCLGQLSNVYRNVIRRKFCLFNDIGGTAIRLIASSAAFVELDDTDGQGVSKARLAERLRVLFQQRGNDVASQDLHWMTEYCYRSVKGNNTENSIPSELLSILSSARSSTRGAAKMASQIATSNEPIDSDSFSSAYTAQEPITFMTLTQLFSSG